MLAAAAGAIADPHVAAAKAILPAGLTLEVMASGLKKPRAIDVSEDGHVAISSNSDTFHILLAQPGTDDYVLRSYNGLTRPSGVAWAGKNLLVADAGDLLLIGDPSNTADSTSIQMKKIGTYVDDDRGYGSPFIEYTPDGKLFLSLPSPCNSCPTGKDHKDWHGVIIAFDTKNPANAAEVHARGLRNSAFFDFHPITGEMWATDTGRYGMEQQPQDELNHIPHKNLNFGFPFCHQGDLPDPKYGKYYQCDRFVKPKLLLGERVQAQGIHFIRRPGGILPLGSALVALRGHWKNDSERAGFAVRRLHFSADGQRVIANEPFIEGWLDDEGRYYARPYDIAELRDGSIIITDEANHAIYRIRIAPDGQTQHQDAGAN